MKKIGIGPFIINKLESELNNTIKKQDKAVILYALDMMNEYLPNANYEKREASSIDEMKSWILNGAKDWKQFSYGGCSLVYNYDIIFRIKPDSYVKAYAGNPEIADNTDWLKLQTSYLVKAWQKIKSYYKLYEKTY